MKRIVLSLALIGVLFCQTACNGIAALAKTEATIEASCNSAATTVITANQQGLISTADASAILAVILKVEQANGLALTATAAINSLNGTSQASILADLSPVVAAVDTAVTSGTVNIKDPATQKNVLLALTLIQTGLNSAVAILKAAK